MMYRTIDYFVSVFRFCEPCFRYSRTVGMLFTQCITKKDSWSARGDKLFETFFWIFYNFIRSTIDKQNRYIKNRSANDLKFSKRVCQKDGQTNSCARRKPAIISMNLQSSEVSGLVNIYAVKVFKNFKFSVSSVKNGLNNLQIPTCSYP